MESDGIPLLGDDAEPSPPPLPRASFARRFMLPLAVGVGLLIGCVVGVVIAVNQSTPPKNNGRSHGGSNDAAPVFHLQAGTIEGVWLPPMTPVPGAPTPSVKVAAMLGVPYAEPPVGRQGRWQPPRMLSRALNHYQATSTPEQCVQWMYQSVNPPNASMSEDCLHLNIYTPRTPSAHASRSGNASSSDGNKLPIFFWVYGGGNTVGSTAFYGPVENLVTLLEGKAIVVAPNYRVGNFGFLALHELTEASPYRVSGNYGLLDLQMALQWVKTNAEGFGGDPNKVTLIGQSSGGTDILALLSSSFSTGLFSGAISLSGSPNITMDLHTTQTQDSQFLANTGCANATDKHGNNRSTAVLDCLYNLTAQQVAQMSPAEWEVTTFALPDPGSTPETPPSRAGLVVVNNLPVTQPLLSGLHIDVPTIISTMECENDFMPTPNVSTWSAQDFETFLNSTFGLWGDDVVSGLSDAYSAAANASGALAYYQLAADVGVTCGNAAVVKSALVAGRHAPIYLAQVTQSPGKPYQLVPGTASTLPFHMWDYIAGFGAWDLSLAGETYTPTSDDLLFGAMLRSAWLELADTGRIHSTATASWEASTNRTGPITNLVNTRNFRAVGDFKTELCASLRDYRLGQRYWWVN